MSDASACIDCGVAIDDDHVRCMDCRGDVATAVHRKTQANIAGIGLTYFLLAEIVSVLFLAMVAIATRGCG